MFRLAVATALLALVSVSAVAQEAAPAVPRTDAEIEQFLLHARVVKTRRTSKGITGSIRATLSDGAFTHDAQIQEIDEYRNQFMTPQGPELNFRDTWAYNVAGYKVARLLGLDFVPVSVKRAYNGRPAAFTWWIDDVMMDEGERLKKKTPMPDALRWNEQMWTLRVFDQLIANTDRNLQNLLITSDWRIWAIDHSRAFRTTPQLRTVANVTRCRRDVFEKMKALDAETLKAAIGEYMYTSEIPALLARRDEIVRILEKSGPGALYPRRDGMN